jgi:hypothetical protein
MSGLSSIGENMVLDALLAARFISLHTSDPGNAGSNEVSGGGYARQPVAFTKTGANPTIAANTAIIQFPVATVSWGTITSFGLWSAASGGSFLGGWPVTTSKTIGPDDSARWEAGKLRIGTDELIP